MDKSVESLLWAVAMGLVAGVSTAVVRVGRRVGWEVERESPDPE